LIKGTSKQLHRLTGRPKYTNERLEAFAGDLVNHLLGDPKLQNMKDEDFDYVVSRVIEELTRRQVSAINERKYSLTLSSKSKIE